MTAPRVCFDRILPSELNRPQRLESMGPGRLRAIAPKKNWVVGTTIHIRFVGGNAAQRKMVEDIAPKWTLHANLNFVFTQDSAAEIRVNFDANDGAWSYVGIDNLSIPRAEVTLNLGWQDEAVILHEFGHMIGLAHEHQNPDGGIIWNEPAVIAALSGPPNYWDEATIRHNVLRKYTADQINGTRFDPDSIMLYAFPGGWTQNRPEGTRENTALSGRDVEFICGPKMYPRAAAPPADRSVDLPVWSALSGSIERAGEEDLYKLTVGQPGTYVVETEGGTDVYLSVFGPNSLTRLVAKDDDGGAGSNARVEAAFEAGTYYAVVRHFSPTRTGPYQIFARRLR